MTFRYLESPDDPAFPQLLEIYHEAFPVESREPDERLVQELRGEYRLPFRFLVAEEDGVVGFARFCRVPEQSFGFLIHIAVHEASRGNGVGTQLLQRVIAEAGPIIAEIELDGPVRRWYERQGFELLTETYTQPALHEDTEPVPFALMGSAGVGLLGPVRPIVTAFYVSVWQLPQEHPLVQRALLGVSK